MSDSNQRRTNCLLNVETCMSSHNFSSVEVASLKVYQFVFYFTLWFNTCTLYKANNKKTRYIITIFMFLAGADLQTVERLTSHLILLVTLWPALFVTFMEEKQLNHILIRTKITFRKIMWDIKTPLWLVISQFTTTKTISHNTATKTMSSWTLSSCDI